MYETVRHFEAGNRLSERSDPRSLLLKDLMNRCERTDSLDPQIRLVLLALLKQPGRNLSSMSDDALLELATAEAEGASGVGATAPNDDDPDDAPAFDSFGSEREDSEEAAIARKAVKDAQAWKPANRPQNWGRGGARR